MFPKRSACYMNLMQYHDNSPMESLKQTMLNQESIFRNQVQELHRLYQIQAVLMKNLKLEEVPKTQSLNYFRKDHRVNWSRYDQRPPDLEVPLSSCASNFDKRFLIKGNGWGTREKPVEIEDYFHGDTEYSHEEATLSLSIGRDTSQKTSGRRTQYEKGCLIVPQDPIELEESIGTMLRREAELKVLRDAELKSAICRAVCAAPCQEMNASQSNYGCKNSTDKYFSNGPKKLETLRDEGRNILEQNYLNQGERRPENLLETDIAVIGKMFHSHRVAYLDLNSPQPDEMSLDLKDLRMDYASAATSSGVVTGEFQKATAPDAVSWTRPNENCSTQVSAPPQHDTSNSVLTVSKITENNNASGSKMCHIDLESFPMSPCNCSEDDDCLCEAAEVEPDFPGETSNKETVTEVNAEKGDEVLVHQYLCNSGETAEDNIVIDERSPALSKCDYAGQDPSSSLKTMQSGTYMEKSFSRMNSFQNSDSSQVDSSAIGESKSRSSDEENGGTVHDDPVIQKGAVSLVYFLLEARREHDCATEVKNTKEKENQRECSIDSFESIVLKLQESNADDYCVSSIPYEINDVDNKDCGIKLRRGRRLKDFQKEILPSLPSLSRQEICEDIRILESAIRSREYKRFRSQITTEQKWFTPVRSRRSRLNYIGRRYYK